MQMAAGREHRQSDRSGNSSWMEVSLQKERRGEDGVGQNTSGKAKFFCRGTAVPPQRPHVHKTVSAPEEVCSGFLF